MGYTAHSALGASNSKRWMACPGSVAKCAAVPPAPESSFAREGTMAHDWAAYCLSQGEIDCNDYLGVEAPSAELAAYPPLKRDMADAVNVYLDHAYSLLRPEHELFVEQRFALDFIREGMFGTNDLAIFDVEGKALHVRDYKHGAGVFVSAEDNTQLKYYALGALWAFRDREIETVTAGIVQPRCGGEPVRIVTYHALDIWEWGAELKAAADATAEPNAAIVAGEHCRFCAAAATCEAFRTKARAVAVDAFDVVTNPETLSPDDLADRLAEVETLRLWCKAIEDRAEREAQAGNIPRGFKFVQGRGQRAWTLAEDEIIRAVKERTGADISETVCLSPAKAEKALGKSEYKKVAELVANRFAKPSLVRESDKRPAISFDDLKASAVACFETIE